MVDVVSPSGVPVAGFGVSQATIPAMMSVARMSFFINYYFLLKTTILCHHSFEGIAGRRV
jgi:hypothetical protein